MTKIQLYGALRKKFGRFFTLNVSSAAEAIRALCAVVPGFETYLREHSAPGYKVLVADEPQTADELSKPCGGQVIKIVPVVAGGKSEIIPIILGIVLVVAGSYATVHGGPTVGPMMVSMGWGMIFGGVAQLIAGNPQMDKAGSENDAGHSFNGAENTTAEGHCVPIGYGELIIGSRVISAGTTTDSHPLGSVGGSFGGSGFAQVAGIVAPDIVFANAGNGDSVPWQFVIDPAS